MGQDVWIVSNDKYEDHVEEFPWFRDFPNKIEFVILEGQVQLDPPQLGAPREGLEPETPTLEEISPPTKGRRIVKISQMPSDPDSMNLPDLDEFLELFKSSEGDKIFLTKGNLWFGFQGKLVRHPMRPPFSKMTTLDPYIYARSWKLEKEEEYQLWVEKGLEKRG